MNIDLFNYEVDAERSYYDEKLDLLPKSVTYYIVYRNVDFSILVKKLGIEDLYEEIVKNHNGEVVGEEDEFYHHLDAMDAINEIKERFTDREWYMSILSKNILKILSNGQEISEKTLEDIKNEFYMLEEEDVVEALVYIVKPDRQLY
ncbi:hypothetical protein [Alkaliphilus sp. B6464]|uniref:hypothetical protein n=1 Tax=Alkaliphilus sp. B6464 TaxID=2731219 RepID=UPI001BA486DF|nr:hypothetical protein [Alkaliphilus sp. B6464]QUH22108.1 hypothetical protein HYG84_19570 [Alkaliphilus sp. B6464]